MAIPIVWPHCVLTPRSISADVVPFSRTGGRTLGGIERTVRTDRGFWSVTLDGIIVRNGQQERCWNGMRVMAGGRTGLWAVPVRSWRTAPFASGTYESAHPRHSDGTGFSDGSSYRQNRIVVALFEAAPLGATVVKLQRIRAEDDLSGVRFSHEYAAYETGPALSVVGDVWTVPITPAIRAPIPAGALLDFDMPRCLCRLANDRGMDLPQDQRGGREASVEFVEAVDYWNDMAAA